MIPVGQRLATLVSEWRVAKRQHEAAKRRAGGKTIPPGAGSLSVAKSIRYEVACDRLYYDDTPLLRESCRERLKIAKECEKDAALDRAKWRK